MKKLILIIIMLAFAKFVYAQQGLNVAPFFSGTYASNPDVTIVLLSGKKLEKKGLSKYSSVSVAGNSMISDKITAAVVKDGSRAVSKEVSYKGGKLYYGFYFMGGRDEHRKYLLFLDRRPDGKEKTTLIFIEGDLDSKDVMKMIK